MRACSSQANVNQNDFRQGFLKNKDRKLVQTLISRCFRYIDDVMLLNNSRFGDYLHLIYLNSLK